MKVLEDAIKDFFSLSSTFSKLKSMMTCKNTQPRLIDFYVTQFSKNNPEFYMNEDGINDVYNSYKLQLKGYHKKYFNLFCKKNNICIKCGDLSIILPLAKCNVYKWLIKSKIDELLNEKHSTIQKRYYDFRKNSLEKNQKRGKLSTFISTPLLIKGMRKAKKKILCN